MLELHFHCFKLLSLVVECSSKINYLVPLQPVLDFIHIFMIHILDYAVARYFAYIQFYIFQLFIFG